MAEDLRMALLELLRKAELAWFNDLTLDKCRCGSVGLPSARALSVMVPMDDPVERCRYPCKGAGYMEDGETPGGVRAARRGAPRRSSMKKKHMWCGRCRWPAFKKCFSEVNWASSPVSGESDLP